MNLQVIADLVEDTSYLFLAELVRVLKPAHVLELGTGDGKAAHYMLRALGPKARLTTINLLQPESGDDPGRYLEQWRGDRRLVELRGNTVNPMTAAHVAPGIDMMLMDSRHTTEHVRREWELYEPKLSDRAVVFVDDLRMYDLMLWWGELLYEKRVLEVRPFGLGVFLYERK